ncbi:glycosyltransferase family 2 protein [uncultured Algimonas sp.]|uniref:glycosyltransferase family 2 protein n=1 Tax=uncultured Algimonas sp. TaxID=1547920 RepID=UPI0026112E80|nr:glycosyltransferase family 2 protein [uncultured Algimonas sp.]
MSEEVETAETKTAPDLAVVLPAYNESGNLGTLIAEIDAALAHVPHEIVVTDDGSTDDTQARLLALKADYPQLRVLSHRRNAGQSRALRTAIMAARAPVIATMDSDGQNVPADIPALYAQLSRSDAPDTLAMVGGRRAKRRDTVAKRLGSRVGNGVRKRLLHDEADDTGCGLKVFRRQAFLELPYFDHIHRYLPALMLREGYTCEYRDVDHRPRGEGESKYTNFGRLKVSLADLRGVRWLNSRARQSGGYDEL